MNRRFLLLSTLFLSLAMGVCAQGMMNRKAGNAKMLRFDNAKSIKTLPKGLKKVADSDKLSAITGAESYGQLKGDDGTTWMYTVSTQESAEFPYCYGSADINIYDAQGQVVGSLHYDVPAGQRVNYVEPFGTVSTRFYDTNSSTKELTVYVHEIGENYTSIDHILVYNTKGELLKEHDAGNVLWVDASQQWTTYQRAIFVKGSTDEEGNPTTKMTVMKQASWGSPEPEVEHEFELRDDLTEYSNGPTLNTYIINGALYYVLSYYEKPFVKGYDANYDLIIEENNSYCIDIYDKSYNKVKSLSVPVTAPDGAYCSMYSLGIFSFEDVTKGYFTGDDKFNIVITRTDIRFDTDDDNYPNTFLVYDEDGNLVNTIAENVIAWKKLKELPYEPDQVGCVCLDKDEQTLEIINLPECQTQLSMPSTLIDGRRISNAYDRYPVGDTYQYAIGMGDATSNENNDVIASIGWFTNDGELDHYVNFNLGQNGEFFTPLIEGYALNPALFNTDTAHEYVFIAKVGRTDGSSIIDNVLVITDENGNTLKSFNGGDTDMLRFAAIVDTEISKPRLIVGYENVENGLYDLDFYSLPFSKFAQGGDGTAANPYVISSAGDMFQIASAPDASYVLGTDIDMATIAEPWTPVETFSGKIDGNGHTISNLYIKDGNSYSGLFSYMDEDASLKNVTFKNAHIHVTADNQYTGLVAGMSIQSEVENVHVNGLEVTADANADSEFGGIIGQATYYTKLASIGITDADIQLPGCASVGGIAGDTRTGTTIDACLFKGNAVALRALGGIVGTSGTDCTVKNCHVNASLVASHTLGGVVGDAARAGITNNYVEGTLEATATQRGSASVGGLVGRAESDWSNGKTKLYVGNVIALSSITAPEDANAVHRVAGFTIADEEYEEGEKHMSDNGFNNNYVSPSLVITPALTDAGNGVATVNGADYASINRSFLEGLGFAYGDTSKAPWKGDAAPALYFETSIVDGITSPSVVSGSVSGTSAIYNISGQRVTVSRPGIYIVNGKKLILK